MCVSELAPAFKVKFVAVPHRCPMRAVGAHDDATFVWSGLLRRCAIRPFLFFAVLVHQANGGWTQGVMNAALLGLTPLASERVVQRAQTKPAKGHVPPLHPLACGLRQQMIAAAVLEPSPTVVTLAITLLPLLTYHVQVVASLPGAQLRDAATPSHGRAVLLPSGIASRGLRHMSRTTNHPCVLVHLPWLAS